MSNLILTIVLSTIICILCLLGLGISYLLTGKNRLKGSCGGLQNVKDKSLEGGFCPVCKRQSGSCENLEEKKKDSL